MESGPTNWPDAVALLGIAVVVVTLIGIAMVGSFDFRKTKIVARQEDDLRQLVQRYEQLAANSLDAQQRIAADVSELRSRTAAIEQMLRTVE